jgi:hypothetical protein
MEKIEIMWVQNEELSNTLNIQEGLIFQDFPFCYYSKIPYTMGNIETTYVLQHSDTYKVKVNFKKYVTLSRGDVYGVECSVCPRYDECYVDNETDVWYKEVHGDDTFSLYVKDSTGVKWYIHEYHEHIYSYLGCFTAAALEPRRYVVEDSKIRVKGSPPFMRLGVTRWYPGFTVIDSLRDSRVFIDVEKGENYYAFAVYWHGEPLELVETTVGRRLPLLKKYFAE